MATGLYKTGSPKSGDEHAMVDYGSNQIEIPRARYETQNYEPPFDTLPTREQYYSQNT